MANDISLEVVNYKQELKRIEEEIAELGSIRVSERIKYATDQLKVVTPVDTGRARKGWRNEIVMKRTKSLEDVEAGTIINEVEYISTLNNGHSKQAPKYFIEQVLTRIGILTPN